MDYSPSNVHNWNSIIISSSSIIVVVVIITALVILVIIIGVTDICNRECLYYHSLSLNCLWLFCIVYTKYCACHSVTKSF